MTFNVGDKVVKAGSPDVFVVVSVSPEGMVTVRPNKRGRPVFSYVSSSELTLVAPKGPPAE